MQLQLKMVLSQEKARHIVRAVTRRERSECTINIITFPSFNIRKCTCGMSENEAWTWKAFCEINESRRKVPMTAFLEKQLRLDSYIETREIIGQQLGLLVFTLQIPPANLQEVINRWFCTGIDFTKMYTLTSNLSIYSPQFCTLSFVKSASIWALYWPTMISLLIFKVGVSKPFSTCNSWQISEWQIDENQKQLISGTRLYVRCLLRKEGIEPDLKIHLL